MTSTRFISTDEIDPIVRELFSVDRNIVRQDLTDDQLNELIKRWIDLSEKGYFKIPVVFEGTEPVAMYTARLLPNVAGWWVGATKIKHPSTNFHTSAKIMVPALELLLNDMEQNGYYKFWMVAPENHHNIRNSVMKKYSPALNRYDWFDEIIIPQGGRCNVPLFEMHRVIANWTDTVVRMFVLRQEFREPLVKERHAKGLNRGAIDGPQNLILN